MDTITSLCIDSENDILYSGSKDRSVKVWNIRSMLFNDSLYGHTDDLLEIVPYSKDRVISVGADNQLIFYKVTDDTQLLYKNTKSSNSCVTVLDDEYIVTGSDQSTLDLWSLKKK